MVKASDYIIQVTAGPSYDSSTHSEVNVNTPEPVKISSAHLDASVKVRIKNYRGFPKGSPSTCEYFSHPKHTSDLYSISFSFSPKQNATDEQWTGDDLIFGNDFDHPIKDRLPPGFSYAFKFVTWSIDPGMFGDPYADEPYIYSPMLSSVNSLHIGEKTEKPSEQQGEDWVILEGARGDGELVREGAGVPEEAAARQKHFLDASKREGFKFEAGREYSCDFFNPYLDFNDFALKLPVISIPIIGHWDGQPLRYVLKRRYKDKPIEEATLLFVVCISLIPKAESEEKSPEQIKEETHRQEMKEKNARMEPTEDDVD